MSFDPAALDHNPPNMLEAAKAQGVPTVSCSWVIYGARRRTTKKWVTFVVFFEEETKKVRYVHEFGDTPEVLAFGARLRKGVDLRDDLRAQYEI